MMVCSTRNTCTKETLADWISKRMYLHYQGDWQSYIFGISLVDPPTTHHTGSVVLWEHVSIFYFTCDIFANVWSCVCILCSHEVLRNDRCLIPLSLHTLTVCHSHWNNSKLDVFQTVKHTVTVKETMKVRVPGSSENFNVSHLSFYCAI